VGHRTAAATIIERTSKDHSRKQIVVNPDRVREWFRLLFENHPYFLKMAKDGELELSAIALSALQSESQLAEVMDDVENVGNIDDNDANTPLSSGTLVSSGILQAELGSGMSRAASSNLQRVC